MRIFIKTLFVMVSLGILLSSCEKMVEDINDNPNNLLPEDLVGNADLLLKGAQLADIISQLAHSNRIAAMYSGQLIGYQSLYSSIYGYDISTVESVQTWSRTYVGVVPNVRVIREMVPDDLLLGGICKIMEAHVIGSAASIFGDVPYSEINNPDIDDPKFDSQLSVFTAVNTLLDEAIADLAAAPGRTISNDIFFEGDASQWMAVAYTLKARHLLQMKEYALAYTAAQSGISDYDDNLTFRPLDSDPDDDENLLWHLLSGSREGDIGNQGSFLIDSLLDSGTGFTRNNAKTDETARMLYYTIEHDDADDNEGIAEKLEPMELVSFEENALILTECAARTIDLATGLGHLNTYRQWLNAGGRLNDNFIGETYLYTDYIAADFANGGMENLDGISDLDAFLREVIEERYVSGFGSYMPFNDVRRLMGTGETILIVPYPLNPGGTQQPQRLPYSDSEINSNSNIDADPGIYVVTGVNQ